MASSSQWPNLLLLRIAIKVIIKIFNLSYLFHISWQEELVLQLSSNFVLAFPDATPTPTYFCLPR